RRPDLCVRPGARQSKAASEGAVGTEGGRLALVVAERQLGERARGGVVPAVPSRSFITRQPLGSARAFSGGLPEIDIQRSLCQLVIATSALSEAPARGGAIPSTGHGMVISAVTRG